MRDLAAIAKDRRFGKDSTLKAPLEPSSYLLILVSSMAIWSLPYFNYKTTKSKATKGCSKFQEGICNESRQALANRHFQALGFVSVLFQFLTKGIQAITRIPLRRKSSEASHGGKRRNPHHSVVFGEAGNGTVVGISELSRVDKKMQPSNLYLKLNRIATKVIKLFYTNQCTKRMSSFEKPIHNRRIFLISLSSKRIKYFILESSLKL